MRVILSIAGSPLHAQLLFPHLRAYVCTRRNYMTLISSACTHPSRRMHLHPSPSSLAVSFRIPVASSQASNRVLRFHAGPSFFWAPPAQDFCSAPGWADRQTGPHYRARAKATPGAATPESSS